MARPKDLTKKENRRSTILWSVRAAKLRRQVDADRAKMNLPAFNVSNFLSQQFVERFSGDSQKYLQALSDDLHEEQIAIAQRTIKPYIEKREEINKRLELLQSRRQQILANPYLSEAEQEQALKELRT